MIEAEGEEGVLIRRTPKTLPLSSSLMVLAFVLGASVAWACVPQPLISLQPRSSGPPGTELTVMGVTFNGPVEIRWNSIDGALLAHAEGPSFSVPVTIPEQPDGLYVVIAFERQPEGTVGGKALTSFLVNGSKDSPSSANSGSLPQAAESTERWQEGLEAPPSAGPTRAFLTPASVLMGAGLLALGGAAGVLLSRRSQRP